MSIQEIVAELRDTLTPQAEVTWNNALGNSGIIDVLIERSDGCELLVSLVTDYDLARIILDDYIFEGVPTEATVEFVRIFVEDLFVIRLVRRWKWMAGWLQISFAVQGSVYSAFRKARNIEPWEQRHLRLMADEEES
ncbi:hypothetical protein MXD63_24060 [Frankia sp. Cpl3]|nr:hypothetical protein [Frankia sp. Cpl3]